MSKGEKTNERRLDNKISEKQKSQRADREKT